METRLIFELDIYVTTLRRAIPDNPSIDFNYLFYLLVYYDNLLLLLLLLLLLFFLFYSNKRYTQLIYQVWRERKALILRVNASDSTFLSQHTYNFDERAGGMRQSK